MLKNMKIKKSLLMGFAIVIGVSVAIIIACIHGLNKISDKIDEKLSKKES